MGFGTEQERTAELVSFESDQGLKCSGIFFYSIALSVNEAAPTSLFKEVVQASMLGN